MHYVPRPEEEQWFGLEHFNTVFCEKCL